MAGLFDAPKLDQVAVPNPADTQNRLNDALTRRLQAGGTNADLAGQAPQMGAPQAAPRPPSLTGLN